jgi:hypothetical protein
MYSLTRRQAMGTLIILPGISILKSLGTRTNVPIERERETASSVTTLNVVFHGLFAFVVWNNLKYIQAIAPVVSNHSYFAGGRDLTSLQPLAEGQTYELSGVNSGVFSNGFDASLNSVFVGVHDTDFTKAYCQILLPFPDAVSQLRVVPTKPAFGDFYLAAPRLKQKPISLPLIHNFSYTLTSSNKPTLGSLSGLKLDQTSSSYNLHLRAEPPVEMSGGPVGFASLNGLFPELKAELNPLYDTYYAPPDSSFPSGLSSLDECTLEELNLTLCPPPPTAQAKDSKDLNPLQRYPLDGKLVNCHSVVILE